MISTVFMLTACDTGDGGSGGRPSTNASERSTDRPSKEPDATSTMGERDATSSSSVRSTSTDGAKAPRSREDESREPRSPDAGRTTTPAQAADRSATPAAAPTQTTTRATQAAKTTPAQEPAPAQVPAPAQEPPPASVAAGGPEPTQSPPATPASTPMASASAVAATEPAGVGPFGWLILGSIAAAMVIGGLLIYRSQRKSAWDAEVRGSAAATRAVIATRLPPVLAATTPARRALRWPPVRDELVAFVTRWDGLTEHAVGDSRRNWASRVSGLLRDLIAAVDADNEALATGRDQAYLRSRIDELQRDLEAVFDPQFRPEPPAAGQPGSTAFGT
ncbi:MAG TPA: hypothetical protein VF657_24550 [Actinoplanes sp.]